VRRLVAALLLLAASAATADVHTMLEPRVIDEMETARLTLRVAGTAQLDAPDFSALEEDFEILGTQSSSRLSSINGRTSAVVEYQISLRPRHTGHITLPRLKVGDEYSESVELTVNPMDPDVRDAIARMIYFETELTANPVYVQAETVLIRRLYYSAGVQIYSDLPGVPQIPNAVVVSLGDTRSDSTIRDGRRYGVIEQRFAIFPEQSGTLTIPSISVTSSVRLQAGGRTRRSGIRVGTEDQRLEVLPIPPEYPAGEPWLPAESLTLDQTWEPDRTRFDVGEPVRVRLDALLVGNIASAIPPISLELPDDSFKIYPEAPELTEDSAGSRVVGRRSEHFALVPTRPGEIRLPARGLTWWDTESETVRRTELPARKVTIVGEPAVVAPPGTASAEAAAPVSDVGGDDSTPEGEAAATGALPLAMLRPWLLVALVLVILAVVGALAYRRAPSAIRRRIAGPGGRPRASAAPLKSLERRCRENDPAGARRALGDALGQAWGCPAQEAIRRFRQDPEAAAALERLDVALYGNDTQTRKADLTRLAALARAAVRARRDEPPRPGLPALYG